jgi:hypothetical protein
MVVLAIFGHLMTVVMNYYLLRYILFWQTGEFGTTDKIVTIITSCFPILNFVLMGVAALYVCGTKRRAS